jgi:hypothetical protein
MGKKNLFFPMNNLITSPLFPIQPTLRSNTIRKKKKKGKNRSLRYPAKVRTTKPPTNTSESVVK